MGYDSAKGSHDLTYILKESCWLVWEAKRAKRQKINLGGKVGSYNTSSNEGS